MLGFTVFFLLASLTMLGGCSDDDEDGGPLGPQDGDNVIVPAQETLVIEEEDTPAITAYDAVQGKLTLRSDSEEATSIEPGSIVIGQDDQAAPYGFLRRVISVQDDGPQVVVETEPAQLAEAFETLQVSETLQLRPSQIESSKLYRGTRYVPTKDDETFAVDLDCVLYDFDGDPETTGDQIKIAGEYRFTAEMFTDFDISFFTLNKMELGIETTQEADVDVLAGLEWEFENEQEVDLWDVRLGAIPVAGVIFIVPTLTVEAHVHGDLTVTLETGISFEQVIRNGVGYDRDASPQFYTISESDEDFEYDPPELSAEFDFEAGASLNASCLLYGVAGPYMAGKTGFHFNSQFDADPSQLALNMSLDAIFYAVVGVQMDAGIFELDWNQPYEIYTYPVGSWEFPLAGSGAVTVDVTPDGLAGADWTLSGTEDRTGTGDAALEGLPAGQYTLTWSDISGYQTPSEQSEFLNADGEISFTGHYLEDGSTGDIVIDQTPDDLAGAAWTLSGPHGQTGSGDAELRDIPAGAYTLSWTTVEGYTSPETVDIWLEPGAQQVVTGVYTDMSAGDLRIVTERLNGGSLHWPYEFRLEAAGGDFNRVWRVAEGGLPPGLTLVNDVIVGTPELEGTWDVTLQVESGPMQDSAEFELRVGQYYYWNLEFVGGEINDQSLAAGNQEIDVSSGEAIQGSFDMRFTHNRASTVVFPLAASPNWGERDSVFWLESSDMRNGRTYTVDVDLIAPDQPGTYFLVAASFDTYTAAEVMSATSYHASRPVWNNGDDVYDWSSLLLEEAMSEGQVFAPQYNGDVWRMRMFAANAVKIIVE
jgi:hypothetical protein